MLLLAPDLDGAMALRDVLAMPGKLCCHGLIRIIDAPANHLHRAFALGDGVLPALTTQGIDWAARFPDPAGVSVSDAVSLDVLPDADRLNRIAARLIFPGDTMVGLWGRSRDGVDDAVAALARAAGRPLRRLGSGDAAAISSAFATARRWMLCSGSRPTASTERGRTARFTAWPKCWRMRGRTSSSPAPCPGRPCACSSERR